MAIDNKYGKVTLEHGTIGEDEPVVVFRARDLFLPTVLLRYHRLCSDSSSPNRHLGLILESRNQILLWQEKNGYRVPNSNSSQEWRA